MGPLVANPRVAAAVLRDRVSRATRERVPEPMVMDDAESVDAFHSADPILQLPVYRLSAEAMSRLLPEAGVVLDLGSGSGRLLAHLAMARPDVRIVGTDLAETMLATGRTLLRSERLDGRVELRHADMTALPDDLPERVDLVSTVWALHHLPTEDHLRRCLAEIARVRAERGSAVWIFDFARLRRDATIEELVRLSPEAPARLRQDGIASEHAAWSVGELQAAMSAAGLSDLVGGRDRAIGHLQAYHATAPDAPPSGHDRHWAGRPLGRQTERLVRLLRFGFPRLP